MSRTYRARGTAPQQSQRWVEGNLSLERAMAKNRQSHILAHYIFNLPCVIRGKPVLYVERQDKYYEWTTENDHTQCLHAQGVSYAQSQRMLATFAPHPVTVAPLIKHPYIRVRRASIKSWNNARRQGERTTERIRLYELWRRNELDRY